MKRFGRKSIVLEGIRNFSVHSREGGNLAQENCRAKPDFFTLLDPRLRGDERLYLAPRSALKVVYAIAR